MCTDWSPGRLGNSLGSCNRESKSGLSSSFHYTRFFPMGSTSWGKPTVGSKNHILERQSRRGLYKSLNPTSRLQMGKLRPKDGNDQRGVPACRLLSKSSSLGLGSGDHRPSRGRGGITPRKVGGNQGAGGGRSRVTEDGQGLR